MIVNCPNCGKQLKLGEKIRDSVRLLEPGKRIKIKCAQCHVPFGLDMSMDRSGAAGQNSENTPRHAGKVRIKPPAPPSTEWLKDGTFEDKDVVEDIPKSLVLMPDIPGRDIVSAAAVSVGYRVEMAETPEEAIEKMLFVTYSAVFLHSGFQSGGIRSGAFHKYIRSMNMARRRYIFYVLLGEQFETLYDLQALSYSANLVVGDKDIPYISTILKKAIPEYEVLFGPLMEELRIAGKM